MQVVPLLSVMAIADIRKTSKRRQNKTNKATSAPLQVFGYGDPAELLRSCTKFWNGEAICPLTVRSRRELMSIVTRWDVEDFHSTARGTL